MRDEGQKLHGRKILVTGGCGFIGSALVRHLVSVCGARVLNVDALTYAGDPSAVAAVAHLPNYEFEQLNICDTVRLTEAVRRFEPDAIVHLAAESHVDRSIDRPADFIQTNILGSYALLETAVTYFRSLEGHKRDQFRFLHISTDEVYGALDHSGARFTEASQMRPNSPYAASKAASDHLVRAWGVTYNLPVIISNCSNNYGPFQFPEKMIPTMILSALHGLPLPVYGTGENVRDWLFVDDHVAALVLLLTAGRPGETYLIGGGAEICNIDLVRKLCSVLDELRPGCPHEDLITFVADRPGHDLRYAVDSSKIRTELGWRPRESLASGLEKTVHWYLANESWWKKRLNGGQIGERLGLTANGERAAPSMRVGHG